jgi:hypothetical protein
MNAKIETAKSQEGTFETSKPKSSWGGKRPNSGNKKGKKMPRTIEKIATLKEYQARILKNADKLFNSQFANAVGNVLIYRVDEKEDKKGKITRTHTLVTNPEQIKKILDESNGNGGGKVGDDFFIITTQKPDNMAITDMLDRAFGKPTQTNINENNDTSTSALAQAILRLSAAKEKQLKK